MAEYVATARLYVGSKVVEVGEKFSSDAEPGTFWKAVKAAPADPAPDRKTLTLPDK